MNTNLRALSKVRVGLSISVGEDSAVQGFPSQEVNRLTVLVAASVLGQGGTVVFGHDWRPDGVMEAVHSFALRMYPSIDEKQPLLVNLLPWPDEFSSYTMERRIASGLLRVQKAGLPRKYTDLGRQALAEGKESPLYQFVRAIAFRHLRRKLNRETDARICFGGKKTGFQGFYPGVIEEALNTFRSRKPLYLCSMIHGATSQIIDAIEGHAMPPEFCRPKYLGDAQAAFETFITEGSRSSRPKRSLDGENIWNLFARGGVQRISRYNGLTVEENLELFHTPTIDRAVYLALKGLARMRRDK